MTGSVVRCEKESILTETVITACCVVTNLTTSFVIFKTLISICDKVHDTPLVLVVPGTDPEISGKGMNRRTKAPNHSTEVPGGFSPGEKFCHRFKQIIAFLAIFLNNQIRTDCDKNAMLNVCLSSHNGDGISTRRPLWIRYCHRRPLHVYKTSRCVTFNYTVL